MKRTEFKTALSMLLATFLFVPALAGAQEEQKDPSDASDLSDGSDTSTDEENPAPAEPPYQEEEYQPGPAAAPIPAPAPEPAPAPAPTVPPPAAKSDTSDLSDGSDASVPAAKAPPPPPPAQKPQPLNKDGTISEDGGKDEDEDEDGPFAWFSVAPEVGLAIYPAADMTIQGIQLTINRRIGFVGKLHLDLGGAGLSVDLAPLIEAEGSGSFKLDGSQGIGGGMGGDYVGFGGELSILYKFRAKSFFPHIGIGFHGTYLTSDALEYGSELFGRIPIGFTWYMAENIGLVFELGVMYGVTGIRWKFTDAMRQEMMDQLAADYGIDPNTPINDKEDIDQILDDHPELKNDEGAKQKLVQSIAGKTLQFGDGFGFDFMLGLRFP